MSVSIPTMSKEWAQTFDRNQRCVFCSKKTHQGVKNVLMWRNNSQTYNNAVAPKC